MSFEFNRVAFHLNVFVGYNFAVFLILTPSYGASAAPEQCVFFLQAS